MNTTFRGRTANRSLVLAVAALIGAMLADVAETALDPANTGTATAFYEAAAHQHARMITAAMLLLASALLLVPGIFGIAQRLRTRGRILADAARVLALLGAAGHVALSAFYLVFAAIPEAGQPRRDAVALLDHVVNSTELKLLAPLAIAFPFAILVALAASVRGHLAGRWALIPVVAAPVIGIAAPAPDTVKTSCALTLFAVGAAAILRGAFATADTPGTA